MTFVARRFNLPCKRLLALVVCALTCNVLCAAEPVNWRTDRELEQQLETPLKVSWERTPLARAIEGVAASQRVAIVRDRRIDPTQEITLAINSEPLRAGLTKIAAHCQAGYTQVGSVAYLGPPHVAARIASLAALRADEARQLPPEAREKLLLLRTWQWSAAAEPRSLLADLAAEAGVLIVNPQLIPHDLWPAADLPLLRWVDRLTLLAAQFDLTFTIQDQGRRIELANMPDQVLVARNYAGGRNARGLVHRWQRELPRAKFEVDGEEIRVLASMEDHEQLERRLQGAPARKSTVTRGPQVYTLTVEKTALDRLIDEKLAPGLGLEFSWDRAATTAAGIASNQLVSLQVKDATLDELLAAVFQNTGLQARRQGKRVIVRAPQESHTNSRAP